VLQLCKVLFLFFYVNDNTNIQLYRPKLCIGVRSCYLADFKSKIEKSDIEKKLYRTRSKISIYMAK